MEFGLPSRQRKISRQHLENHQLDGLQRTLMIPPAAEWPQHVNLKFANTIQLWLGTDTENQFKKNCSKFKQRLKDLGWINQSISYQFNAQGFRSIEFDTNMSAGMAVGCSYTQGVGLLQHQVWPSIVSERLNYPIYNLGVVGCSIDTVFRLVDYWLPILKPKFLLVACPPKSRIEFFRPDGEIAVCLPNHPHWHWSGYLEWLINSNNAELNFKKNLLAITALCQKHKIAMVSLTIDNDFVFDTTARDLMHSGPKSHELFADVMIQKLKEQYAYDN